MKNKKKKGFTLIELIAVIAILGILAAVLVPNVKGYSNKATIKKVQSNAKIVLNALQAYNADADSPAATFEGVSNPTDYLSNSAAISDNLKKASIAYLQNLANGKKADNSADLDITEANKYK